jgi:hypothetical protein
MPEALFHDLESASDAYANRYPNVRKCAVNSAQDVIETLDAILEQRKGFECKSYVFDSITAYRRMLQGAPDRRKTGDFRDADVNDEIKKLLSRFYHQYPFAICVTAHEKRANSAFEKLQPNHEGIIPDSDPRFSYPFDIVARLIMQNGRHGAVVVKSRFGDAIPVGKFIPDFSYAYILQALGRAKPAQASTAQQRPAPRPQAGQPETPKQILDRLHDRYLRAGQPEGSFAEWLRARNYPTIAKDLVANQGLRERIIRELSALQPAS